EATQIRNDLVGQILDVQNEEPIETLMAYMAQTQHPAAQKMVAYAAAHKTNEASAITGIYRAAMDQAVAEVNEARMAAEPIKNQKRTKAPSKNLFGIGQEMQSQQGATLYSTFMQYYGTQDSLRVGQV